MSKFSFTRITSILVAMAMMLSAASVLASCTQDPTDTTDTESESVVEDTAPDTSDETDPPETDPPETDPPETDPPETDPPETDPPETDPPETDPPETDPPETDPPETDPPETDPPEPETEPRPHEYDEGVVILEPTCVDNGIMRYTCSVCGHVEEEEIEKTNSHTYDEGVITVPPTVISQGEKLYTCTVCGDTYTEPVDMLPVAYVITMQGIGEVPVSADGIYQLADPDKIGYKFVGWTTTDGEAFASAGVITSDVTIVANFELLLTYTIEELCERAEGGADRIVLANDIVVDRTVYFAGQTTLESCGDVKIIRDKSFAGDMFVIGQDSIGNSDILKDGLSKLILGASDGSSKIVIDGNKDETTVSVVGSALFVVNGAHVEMYDGITIANHHKAGNERAYQWDDFLGTACTMGGAAVLIVRGVFDMYGGSMENNSTNDVDIGNDTDGTTNVSSYGGAIYNYGTFNMYGGTLKDNVAMRGGAIYTRKQINIYAGVFDGNRVTNKGGAIATSESTVAEVYIGSEGAAEGTVQFRNNYAEKLGGVYLGYHLTPFIVLGGATFENNSTEGNGGVINTPGPVTIYNSKFINNSSQDHGGVIYQYYKGEETQTHSVTLEGCYFEGNEAGRGGVVTISGIEGETKGSTLTIKDCEFRNNRAVIKVKVTVNAETGETVTQNTLGSGGVIYTTKRATLLITGGCKFIENTAETDAGAIHVGPNTQTTISGAGNEFIGNSGKHFGGAIYLAAGTNSAAISITDAKFAENGSLGDYVTERGGAIYNANCTLNTINCSFSENSSGVKGGAVYVAGAAKYTDGTATLTETDSTSSFADNISVDGGAICMYGRVTIYGGTFTNNTATSHGGSIFVGEKATLSDNGSTYTGNTAKQGGAIYMNSTSSTNEDTGETTTTRATATLNNSIFVENKAQGNTEETGEFHGGAVYVNGGILDATGATFRANTAVKNGGAIYVNNTDARGAVTEQCIFTSNAAAGNGGAVYATTSGVYSDGVEGSSTRGSVFGGDTADLGNSATNGGAIGLYGNVTLYGTVIQNNVAATGGAIYVFKNGLTAQGVSFIGNTATTGSAGAIYVATAATTTSCTFEGNTAPEGYGGTVYVASGATYVDGAENDATLGSTFGGDSAELGNNAISGGAILSEGTTALYGSTFKNNTANAGGAIYASKGELTAANVTFSSNVATGGKAGALYIATTVATRACTFEENKTLADNGGAIYVTGAGIYTDGVEGDPTRGSTFSRNVAAPDADNLPTKNGGAIGSYGVIALYGSTIENNDAANGAAIYTMGELSATNVTFRQNVACLRGGAIYLNGATSVSSCIFNGNKTEGDGANDGHGGAIYVAGATATISDSTFKDNSTYANGGALYVNATATTQSCTFEGNTAANNGGAVYVTSTGIYTDGVEGDPTLGSTFGGDTSEKGNTGVSGGAIFVYGTAELHGSIFTNNYAIRAGAVYVASYNESNGSVAIQNAAFNNNKANVLEDGQTNNGGAIYANTARVSVIGTTFSGNFANTSGGAIYVTKTTTVETPMILRDCSFTGNSAMVQGGAAYMSSTSVVHLGGTVTTADNTVNGKTNNIYVEATTTLVITEDLSADSEMGLTLKNDGEFVSAISEDIHVIDYKDCFTSDEGKPLYVLDDTLVINLSITQQPSAFNDFTVTITGHETTTYQWYLVTDDGRVATDCTSATLSGVDADIYVCVISVGDNVIETAEIAYAPMQSHTICGSSCTCEDTTHTDVVTFKPIATADELKTAITLGGCYYLVNDITLTSKLTISDEVVLCLNGRIISNDNGLSGVLITVSDGASLTITDCSDVERTGYIDPETKLWVEGEYTGEGTAEAVTLTGGIIMGGDGTYGGAIIIQDKTPEETPTSLTVYNINFVNNLAIQGSAQGGAIYANGASTTLTRTTFVANSGSIGGAIYATQNTLDMQINGCTFIGNVASNNGGAIYSGGVLSVNDSVFSGNVASLRGGAIYSGGQLSVNNSAFTGNKTEGDSSSDGHGGAICTNVGSADISNSIFIGNSAYKNGGAIYVNTSGSNKVTTQNCTFVLNVATGNGGAVYVTGTGHYVDGTNVDGVISNGSTFGEYVDESNETVAAGNSAANGGAIGTYGTTELYGTVIKNNTAGTGGAIYANGKTSTIHRAIFANNAATQGHGGAIHVKAAEVTTKSCTFTANKAESGKYGGAVYVASEGTYIDGVEGDATLGSTFGGDTEALGNTATSGGAILSDGITQLYGSTFKNNSANAGGAIYANGKTATIHHVIFANNTAMQGNGGAIYVKAAEVTTKSCTFTANKAESGKYGGAVYVASEGTYIDGVEGDATLGSTFGGDTEALGNTATSGGAILSDGITRLYGSTFKNNSANAGGAIYASKGELSAANAKFFSNVATGGKAGALYISTTVSTKACTFEGNKTLEDNGGAVYVTGAGNYTDGVDGDSTQGSTFNQNVAAPDANNVPTMNGGALGSFGIVTLYATKFQNNSALSGGAMYVAQSQDVTESLTVTVNGCTFENNSAVGTTTDYLGGGAIAATNKISVYIVGGRFTGNSSGYYGGAISAGGTTATATNISISGGTIIENCTVGKTGLALFFKTTGKITVDTITVQNNKTATNGVIYVGAGGTEAHTFNNVTATGNSANKGGVFYISGGTVQITNSEMTGNTASGNNGLGGAIYVSTKNLLTLEGCTISDNEAKIGGGVYATNGYTADEATQITDNTDSAEGTDTDNVYPAP